MKKLQLTDAGKQHESGYNNKFAALEGRDDLDLFLIDAYRAKRKDHVAFFVNPPSLEELLAAQADAALADNQVYGTNPMQVPEGVTLKPMAASTAPASATPATAAPDGSGSFAQPMGTEEVPTTSGITTVMGLGNRTGGQADTGQMD